MNVENIEVGKTYKNYKELCEALEIKYTTGNGKGYKLLDLNRYFEYEFDKYKITILARREIPLLKITNTFSPYRHIIQLLILDLIAQSKDESISLTQDNLFYILHMVNNDFKKYRNKMKLSELSKELILSPKTIEVFYNRHSSNFRSIIEGALKSLEKQKVIEYNYNTRIAYNNYENVLANSFEISRFLECQTDTMEELGYKEFKDVYTSGDYDLLMELSVEKYNERYKTNVNFFYKTYDIIYNNSKTYIENKRRKISDILENEYRINLQYELNGIVLNKIQENAMNRLSSKIFLENEIKLRDKLIKR